LWTELCVKSLRRKPWLLNGECTVLRLELGPLGSAWMLADTVIGSGTLAS
jgi:hypothetical protein